MKIKAGKSILGGWVLLTMRSGVEKRGLSSQGGISRIK
jgi:hypothetical protein